MNYYANMRRIFNDDFDKVIINFINKSPNKPWNWNGIYYNIFTKYKEMFMAKKSKE